MIKNNSKQNRSEIVFMVPLLFWCTIRGVGSYLKLGGQVVLWGDNLPSLVGLGLTDLLKPEWAIAYPAHPSPTPLLGFYPLFLADYFSILATSSWHFKSWKGENNGKFWSRKWFHMTQNPHFRTGTRIQSIGKQRRSLPCREQTKGIHVQKLESPRQKSLFSDELLSTDKSGPAFRRFAWSKTARTGPLYSSRNWILCTCSSHVFTNPEFSTYL